MKAIIEIATEQYSEIVWQLNAIRILLIMLVGSKVLETLLGGIGK